MPSKGGNIGRGIGDINKAYKDDTSSVVITDGELSDLRSATAWLRNAAGKVHVYVIVVGYGPDHDSAIASWQSVAEANPQHVKVETASASTDARAIASRILSMVQ